MPQKDMFDRRLQDGAVDGDEDSLHELARGLLRRNIDPATLFAAMAEGLLADGRQGDLYAFLGSIEPFLLWRKFLPRLIDLRLPGDPLGKGRPRFNRATGRAFTPAKTAAWESVAAMTFEDFYEGAPYEGPVALCVEAVKTRPKRLLRKKDPLGRLHRATAPDGDNVIKIVADALQAAGVVRDDRQVVEWHCRCAFASKEEGPCVRIRAYKLTEEKG